MKKLFLSLSFILLTHLLYAQSFVEKVDNIVKTEFNEKNGPGDVFLISKKGKPIYEKAFGLANLELNVELQPNSVFQIGSMTKQFTAVAVLLLEQEGKLNTSDYISTYIPDYPNGNKISIHHLLTHTSGIKDFTKTKVFLKLLKKKCLQK